MSYRQMYYTSCEKGLSGFAGYQFNAVTPGTPDETMRRVEALTAYEPPRSVGHTPSPAEIADCPVNLCSAPADQVVAQVIFVGEDYSGRFGNYFVHAVAGDLDGTLPIELWRSPMWSTLAVDDPQLPLQPGPLPHGPITRQSVEAFLDRSGRLNLLPTLLSAVDAAVTSGDRSVVIFDSDVGRIAHWIAAASYLLPPATARAMSFATYQHRPGRSRQHVMGTVPGTDFTVTESAFDTFYLFDLTEGRASAVPDRPLAHLLTGQGTVQAERLWRSASPLAAGTERTLEDWYPVVVAAAVLAGGDLDPGDAGPLIGWLREASHLSRGDRTRLARAALTFPSLSHGLLAAIVSVADSTGAYDVLAEAEIRLITRRLDEVDSAAPLRTAQAREHAARGYAAALGTADPAAMIRLIAAAARYEVTLDPTVLYERGRTTIGPALLADPGDKDAGQLLGANARIKEGALAHLATLDTGRAIQAFTSGLDAVLGPPDLEPHPVLREAALIAAARRGDAARVETLLTAVGRRAVFPPQLLSAIWPDFWTAAEAAEVLARSDARLPVGWVEPLINGAIPEPADDFVKLVDLLDHRRIEGRLSPTVQDRLDGLRYVATQEGRLHANTDKTRQDAVERLCQAYDGQAVQARDYLELRMMPAVFTLPAAELLDAYLAMPGRLREALLTELERALDRKIRTRTDPVRAAAVAFAASRIARSDKYRGAFEDLDAALREALPRWPKRDLKKIGNELKAVAPRRVLEFAQWRERHERRGLFAWLVWR